MAEVAQVCSNVVDVEKRKVIWNHDGRGKTTLDHFHVKKYLNEAVDTVRKEGRTQRSQATESGRRESNSPLQQEVYFDAK